MRRCWARWSEPTPLASLFACLLEKSLPVFVGFVYLVIGSASQHEPWEYGGGKVGGLRGGGVSISRIEL
jgi:hypothetical protein